MPTNQGKRMLLYFEILIFYYSILIGTFYSRAIPIARSKMSPPPTEIVKRSIKADNSTDTPFDDVSLLDLGLFLFLKTTDINDNSTKTMGLNSDAILKLQRLIPRIVNRDLWEFFQVCLDGSIFLILIVVTCLYKALTVRINYLKRYKGLQKIRLRRKFEHV